MMMLRPIGPDAEFTHSIFGGGWLLPLTEGGADLAERVLCAEGEPDWPEGHIVEPWQMRELIEWAEVMGVALVGVE